MAPDRTEIPEGHLRTVVEEAFAAQLTGVCQALRHQVHEELQCFLDRFGDAAGAHDCGKPGACDHRSIVLAPSMRSVLRPVTGTSATSDREPARQDQSSVHCGAPHEWFSRHVNRFSAHHVGGASKGAAVIAARHTQAWLGQAGTSAPPEARGPPPDTLSSSTEVVPNTPAKPSMLAKVSCTPVHAWADDDADAGLGSDAFRAKIVHLVRNPNFDYIMCFLILLNAAAIGAQTNYEATHMTWDTPLSFHVLERIFFALFAGELVLRVYSFRMLFFNGADWRWNMFDTVVVGLQLIEIVFGGLSNLRSVRAVRILRLARAIRLVRVIQHVAELRRLVASVGGSMVSLGWTCILLVLLIYTVSLFFTQMISDHRMSNMVDEENGEFKELEGYFGTLYQTMLSFFQAVTGGMDWGDLLGPLMTHVSVWLAPVFCVYISFTVLAMLNVVTAIFVESVLERTKKDRDLLLISNVRSLFRGVDGGICGGMMTWNTFLSKLDTPEMLEFFEAIDVDPSEAPCIFRLLDIDNGGSVDGEEFLNGCLRLRGPSRALDIALMMKQIEQVDQRLQSLMF